LRDRTAIKPVPEDVMALIKYHNEGYRYLVLDPQAYISFSDNAYKWGLPLKGYLGYVDKGVRPLMVFPHFDRAVMERVVFEHSDNLFQSIRFLDAQDMLKISSLRVYDLDVLAPLLSDVLKKQRR
jgi:hypothetical protein